jgi:hypothetical protein
VFGTGKIFPAGHSEGDSDEPNRKYPDGGTMKPLLLMSVGPHDPKLNLGAEMSEPGVAPVVVLAVTLDVVTVSIVPKLSRLSVDNVRVHEKPVEVASLSAPARLVFAWLKIASRQPGSAGRSTPNPSTQERISLAPNRDNRMR